MATPVKTWGEGGHLYRFVIQTMDPEPFVLNILDGHLKKRSEPHVEAQGNSVALIKILFLVDGWSVDDLQSSIAEMFWRPGKR